MSRDLIENDVTVGWSEFFNAFKNTHEIAKGQMKKVDLFPEENRVCFVIYNAILLDECKFIINSMEDIGFKKLEYGENYRTNTRTQITALKLSELFFERVREFLPERWPGVENTEHWQLLNLNERIRMCRYEPGQYFAPHFDGVFKRNYMEQSQLTIMAYLNDEFTGGHTNFLDEKTKPPRVTNALKPETGMILIFQHDMFHEGEQIYTGKKYIMRSDVMYRRILLNPLSDNQNKALNMVCEAEQLEDQSKFEEAAQMYRRAFKLWPDLERNFHK